MGFNSGFKGLNSNYLLLLAVQFVTTGSPICYYCQSNLLLLSVQFVTTGSPICYYWQSNLLLLAVQFVTTGSPVAHETHKKNKYDYFISCTVNVIRIWKAYLCGMD